jgi:hypothetical protein
MADMASAAREDGQVASGRGPRAGQTKRRTFTAAYKLKILKRYEQLEDPAERGALPRTGRAVPPALDLAWNFDFDDQREMQARLPRLTALCWPEH